VQALEDLIVQTEIFLQYSLQTKLWSACKKIAATFPGEEERNTAFAICIRPRIGGQRGRRAPKQNRLLPSARLSLFRNHPAPTSRKKPAYIPRRLFATWRKFPRSIRKFSGSRTPRAMLNTAVNEVGAYLHCSRALAVFGVQGRPPEMAAEFCAAGVRATPGAQVVLLLSQMEKAQPDELGGLTLKASTAPS